MECAVLSGVPNLIGTHDCFLEQERERTRKKEAEESVGTITQKENNNRRRERFVMKITGEERDLNRFRRERKLLER